jgi:2-octaprenyl-6-methoxyphenol hydroxylase
MSQGCDAIVVGRGAAGMVAALALAKAGASVTLVGRATPETEARTVALFAASAQFLSELGVWPALLARAAPLRVLRIIDDTDNLFKWRPLTFEAREVNLDAFGWNIAAGELSRGLRDIVSVTPAIEIVDGFASEPEFADECASILLEQRGRRTAALIVAADGQHSSLRRSAGIPTRAEKLSQCALTAIFDHEASHEDASTEFHARGGPCTLVPLRGSSSSLVWMAPRAQAERLRTLKDDAFAETVEGRVHSILGKMQVAGPRDVVSLSNLHVERFHGTRLALVGEAAHAFPPIGAQGLNLGLRDAEALAAHVERALAVGDDIGAPSLLEDYDRARRFDVASRSAAVTLMNNSLLSTFWPFDLGRGVGMAALDLVGPLRRFVMREGLAPGFGRGQS